MKEFTEFIYTLEIHLGGGRGAGTWNGTSICQAEYKLKQVFKEASKVVQLKIKVHVNEKL